MRRSRMFATASAVALSAALAIIPTTASASADAKPSGSAYALSLRTELAKAPLVKIDPLPVAAYPRGGDKSVVDLGATHKDVVTARGLTASSVLTDNKLTSEAIVGEAIVRDVLNAELVTANCEAGTHGRQGSSSAAKLEVLGKKINVAAEPNTKIDVAGVATVTVNEQIKKGSSLTVNAVHIIIGSPTHGITKADIVLSQAVCAGGPPPTQTTTPPHTTPTTTTTTTGTTAPPNSTSSSATTTTTTPVNSMVTTSSNTGAGVDPAADGGDLADTGVSDALPLLLVAAALLLAGGIFTIMYTRRKRSTTSESAND